MKVFALKVALVVVRPELNPARLEIATW